jgi:hypothetical protein
MKAKRVPRTDTRRSKRATIDVSTGVRLLLNLRESLRQSKTQGLTLADARRRLAARLAGSAPRRKKSAARR